MSIPKGLTREHVLRAIADIDAHGVRGFGASRGYDLVFNGKRYPPKAVLGRAIAHLTAREQSPRAFAGGESTNRVLEGLGFEIVKKT